MSKKQNGKEASKQIYSKPMHIFASCLLRDINLIN